jgi:hypothetical protein
MFVYWWGAALYIMVLSSTLKHIRTTIYVNFNDTIVIKI